MTDQKRSKLRIDWFDGTVSEKPLLENPSSSAQEDTVTEIRKTTHEEDSKKIMGYMKLYELSQQESSAIILRLKSKYVLNLFTNLINSDMQPNFVVLTVKIISKLCSDSFKESKQKVLESVNQSRLFQILKDYLRGLPETRLVDKRTNMLFWENPEEFYNNCLVLVQGFYKLFPGLNLEMINLYNEIKLSFNGVMENHLEQFTDELFQFMENVASEFKRIYISHPVEILSASNEEEISRFNKENNFRLLNIFPIKDDLISTKILDLEPHIVKGAYESVEHYLDVQFKLLREDCYGPLRDGISSYLKDTSKLKYENIRVFKHAKFIRTCATNGKVGILLNIDHSDAQDMSKYKSYNKKFMFGSLLLFTNDNFISILCATVLDSSKDLIANGYVVVEMHTPLSNDSFNESYLMIESDVFFEPYHQVLKVLQSYNSDDLPFKDYIVYVKPIVRNPSYLTDETKYILTNSSIEYNVSVLNEQTWPSNKQLGLDESQFEAFKLALTREFAVIQGPPGTGKTFIGVTIAKTILNNLGLHGKPMIMICYTNHALDQFLEEILTFTQNIIRIGSQSKSEMLEQFTLNNLRAKSKFKFASLYNRKRNEQEQIMNNIMSLQNDIQKCENDIVSYKCIKSYLNFELAEDQKDDPIVFWLFEHLDDGKVVPETEVKNNALESWEEVETHETEIESCFSINQCKNELNSLRCSIKYVEEVANNDTSRKEMEGKFIKEVERIEKRMDFFEKNFSFYLNNYDKIDKKIATESPYKLNVEQRWAHYFKTVSIIKMKLLRKLHILEENLKSYNKELEELRMLVDLELVRSCQVIGVTTTAAARLHKLLQSLQSPIMMVEEAAQVLESHIIASLNKSCQHLILIGDHQQLRPTTACYTLAKKYNLEVSLFERMINNGVHSRRLSVQHRMRPEFIELLVPSVYEDLINDPIVSTYQDIRGMAKNLYFFNHGVFETRELEDSWSHSNIYEAEMTVRLANYIMQQEYCPDDLTILTTYTGQMTLIKNLCKQYSLLEDVKVTVVDNFQGEESKIIILSLVRSNREDNIGFLSEKNRVCVALSRAKEGFYIIGNMDMFSKMSSLWNSIKHCLTRNNSISDALTLKCCNHNNITIIKKPDDFSNTPNGGCKLQCDHVLLCNHKCKLLCHPYDKPHKKVMCDQPCQRKICYNNHLCPLTCGELCEPCSHKVNKTLKCGHSKSLPCFVDVDSNEIACQMMVNVKLPKCGHSVRKQCNVDSNKIKCSVCHKSESHNIVKSSIKL